jgi:hypothetical protein
MSLGARGQSGKISHASAERSANRGVARSWRSIASRQVAALYGHNASFPRNCSQKHRALRPYTHQVARPEPHLAAQNASGVLANHTLAAAARPRRRSKLTIWRALSSRLVLAKSLRLAASTRRGVVLDLAAQLDGTDTLHARHHEAHRVRVHIASTLPEPTANRRARLAAAAMFDIAPAP